MATLTVTNMELEELPSCCICLDTFVDPVSIPCGHNFCLDCIEGFWDTKEQSQCPLCKETFRKRPELRINRGFAAIIQIYRRSVAPTLNQGEDKEDQVQNRPDGEDVPCDVCHGHKSSSVKSCLMCQASYCQPHLSTHLRAAALQKHRLTDPATFPSSHLCRKHRKPLTKFCREEQTPVCEECAEKEHRRHRVVVMERASASVKTGLKEKKAEIHQMILARLRKMEQITNSVDLSKKIKEREMQRSARVCSTLIAAIQKHEVELGEELAAQQRQAEQRAEEQLQELEQEIRNLHNTGSKLQQLEHTQSQLHLLQSFPLLSRLPSTRAWSDVSVQTENFLGTVSRTVHKLAGVCQELANKLSAEDAEKMHQYAVDVTLDPETASGWLLLSPDKKKVSCQKKKDPVTEKPQRFDACVCVLGEQGFKSGRCYWEVQVGDKTDWDLGVAKESINRKGAITVRPDSGYWAICRREGGSLSACAGPSVPLQLRETPQKVGVFLDYEAGSVSFYDADAKTHIYSYGGCSFTEPLYPYLNPCIHDNGRNAAPLVISPVERRVTEGQQDVTIESCL